MGIQGLLPFLARSTRDAHINEFENSFVAIDAYCWLHKGIYSCAVELAMKKPTTKYITYCMRYVEMLLHFNVKPIFVFDGRLLYSKKETEKKRREERKKKYEKGKELIRAGKTSEGRKLLGESVEVTHELAVNLMRECREKNIDCIVAPFEADAQLAFLSLRNIVQCIITEDSDLLVYGCEKVMFKMDTSGRGKLTEKSELHVSLNMSPEELNADLFRYMCILSGCDYLPSLVSIGPANALKFIKLLKDQNIYEALPKLPIYLNKMSLKVTPEYIDGFRLADNTFKHQLVYDPFLRLQVPLLPVENDDEIVGLKLAENLAFQLAIGNMDPITMEKVDNFDPDECGRGFDVLWKTDFLPNATPKPNFVHSSRTISEGKKRQREGLESENVQSFSNDLKKQRLPLSTFNNKNIGSKTVQRVPKTGFIFDPVDSDRKKNVTKPVDEFNLLQSRYFSRQKNKGREIKQPTEVNDRRKDESYEEYLRRLYEEYFPVGSSEDTDNDRAKCCAEHDENSECLSCRKCKKCCGCLRISEAVPHTQQLDNYIRELAEYKKLKKKSPVQHFLLDEIYQTQEEKQEEEKNISQQKEEKTDNEPKDVSPGLSIDFSKILSKIDSCDSDVNEVEMKLIEKENKEEIEEIVCIGGDPVKRSPSPVFKVQKDTKISNRNSRCGNAVDTASTPTSIYFSSCSPGNVENTNPLVSKRRTPLSRKMSSTSFSNVSTKSQKNLKQPSTNRTLFQFGFKKERKTEDEER